MEPSPLAEKLLKRLPKPEGNDMLEIGCGNGRDNIFLAQAGNRVVAVDIAPGAIRIARENAKKAGVSDKINFLVANAENLPFKDKTFDAVYSLSVLHSTVLSASLGEVSRVLKRGGRVMLYLYEMTESGGIKYWFYKKERVEQIAKENNLIIDGAHTGWDKRHEGEATRILVMEMHKRRK